MSELPPQPLAALAPLFGNWTLVFTALDGTEVGRAHSAVTWLHPGALMHIQTAAAPGWAGPAQVDSVIGRDDEAAAYTMLYADSRGVSRLYTMTFDGQTWTQHRHAAQPFPQRFIGTISADHQHIAARWEKLVDDAWEVDFFVTYRRSSSPPHQRGPVS